MTPAALSFDGTEAGFAWRGLEGPAHDIGRDHARHGLTPPAECLLADHPVRAGWAAGRAAFGPRTLAPTPQVRAWLALRLDAWRRGIAFDPVHVTPALLRRLGTTHCPVTGSLLTRAAGTPEAACIERVNESAAYAAGNLVVMSRRAATAKAGRRWDEALACARRIEQGEAHVIDGLGAAEWLRLAVLISYATPAAHAALAALPLAVLPPARLRLLNAGQALQAMLTLQFVRDGLRQRFDAFAALMPDADTRHALRVFLHTLLARRLAAGRPTSPTQRRDLLESMWRDPLVCARWQRLALRLDAAGCERIVAAAERRGLAGPMLRWLPADAATDGWGLVTGDDADHAPPPAPAPRRPTAPPRRAAARLQPACAAPG